MRVRLPDVYRAYPSGYHSDLLPWGWESTTPPGWMKMLPHNIDGSLSGLGRYGRLSGLGQDSSTVDFPTIDPAVIDMPGMTYDPGSGMYFPTVTSSGVPDISPTPTAISTSSGGGMTLAQLLQGAATAATAAAAINRSIQTPSLIPGTNLVYNPATGQLANATGVTAAAVSPIISQMTPLILLAVGAIVVISLAHK